LSVAPYTFNGGWFQAAVMRWRIGSVRTSEAVKTACGVIYKRPASCSFASRSAVEAYATSVSGCQAFKRSTSSSVGLVASRRNVGGHQLWTVAPTWADWCHGVVVLTTALQAVRQAGQCAAPGIDTGIGSQHGRPFSHVEEKDATMPRTA